jgi:hypothetical protein
MQNLTAVGKRGKSELGPTEIDAGKRHGPAKVPRAGLARKR